tara:strand:- start:288 stop:584 length:297 start_codon:yes stop_codon:yes gene_type:complete
MKLTKKQILSAIEKSIKKVNEANCGGKRDDEKVEDVKENNDEELEEEYDPKKADLNKDGEVSDYEEKRGKAAFGESKQNNKAWYDSNLYEKLKSKWAK